MASATARVEEDSAFILDAIRTRALRTDGPFKLGSGGTSPYYLDIRILLNDVRVLSGIARLILAKVPPGTNAVGGLATSSIPISTAIMILDERHRKGQPALRGFWIRSEEKLHGVGGQLCGELHRGERVVVVDDVTTKGNSVLKVVKVVREFGADVTKIVSVVDRVEGAAEIFSQHKIPFDPLFSVKEILDT